MIITRNAPMLIKHSPVQQNKGITDREEANAGCCLCQCHRQYVSLAQYGV